MTQTQAPVQIRGSIDELKANRKVIYSDHYRAQRSPSKKGKTKEQKDPADGINPGVDDSINASERGFDCRRVPGDLTFDNDNICASSGCLYLVLNSGANNY